MATHESHGIDPGEKLKTDSAIRDIQRQAEERASRAKPVERSAALNYARSVIANLGEALARTRNGHALDEESWKAMVDAATTSLPARFADGLRAAATEMRAEYLSSANLGKAREIGRTKAVLASASAPATFKAPENADGDETVAEVLGRIPRA